MARRATISSAPAFPLHGSQHPPRDEFPAFVVAAVVRKRSADGIQDDIQIGRGPVIELVHHKIPANKKIRPTAR
jgi:hypothetical protein